MANPDSALNGQGQAVDLIVDAVTGEERVKAGGRAIPTTGVGDQTTPQLVEDATLLIGHGSKAVAAGPTRTALGSTTPCKRITVKAWVSNSNTLYVGLSTVTADNHATTGGFQLSPGESFTFGIDDLADVYIHGTATEGASFAIEE